MKPCIHCDSPTDGIGCEWCGAYQRVTHVGRVPFTVQDAIKDQERGKRLKRFRRLEKRTLLACISSGGASVLSCFPISFIVGETMGAITGVSLCVGAAIGGLMYLWDWHREK